MLPEAEIGLPLEPAVRLVQEQDRGIGQEREREIELLLRAPTQQRDGMRPPLREAVALEQLPRAFLPHLPQHAARGREIMKVLPRRQLVVEQRHLGRVAERIMALHLARVRRQEPREDAH